MDVAREPLLSPDFLRRLETLELVSRKVRAGRMKGDRLSKRKGRGSEFADFRVAWPPVPRRRPSLPRLLASIDTLEPAGPGDFNAALRTASLTLTGRGVVILVSDFLDKAGVTDGLRYLAARNLDVFVIQV